jgi:hypothetical protein
VTKQSKWSISDELKVFFFPISWDINISLGGTYNVATITLFFQIARELAEKASNQQSGPEKGTSSTVLVGSASVEPSPVPVNQSSSAIGSIDSSLDASTKSVPAGVGPSHNVANASGSNNVSGENGGPSTTVPVTSSTKVPSATDAGTSRFLQLQLHLQLLILNYLNAF